MTVFITSCVIAIGVSALCSLMEAVLLSLNTFRLETLKQQGHRYAQSWLDLKRQVDRPIAAILILNTVAHTGGATVAGGAFDQLYGTEWIWLFSLLFTITILLGTEILPKVIGVSYNERVAVWLGPILRFVTFTLRPLIRVTELVSRPFRQKQETASLSSHDIQTLARLARSHNVIGATQEHIIVSATHFRTTRVESIMIPRSEIKFFSLNRPAEENLELARRTLHTRYPVSRTGEIDDIDSYVNLKEITTLAHDPQRPNIEPFLRPAPSIHAETPINRVFRLLAGKRRHMAVIRNAASQVVGVVTLEDLIEEVMGDIEDEFDETSSEIIPLSKNKWKVGGSARMKNIAEKVGLSLRQDHLALSFDDWITAQADLPPQTGATFQWGDLHVTIQQIRRSKIQYALLERVSGTDSRTGHSPDSTE